jgi:glycine hydroxymethyltransferase
MESLTDNLFEAVESYEQDIGSCLILNAARNVMSPRARTLLGRTIANGDWAGRVRPGDKSYSSATLEHLEHLTGRLIDRLLGSPHAEIRAPTGSVANGLAAVAMTELADEILIPPSWAFGHKSVGARGYPGCVGRRITELPWDARLMQPDLDGLSAMLHARRPKLIILGTSRCIFPEAFAEIEKIAHASGSRLLYDGAHLLGLIAAGVYPNPLLFGFDAIAGSTQKTLPGPLGGLVVCAQASMRDAVSNLADQWISTYSVARLASLTYVLAEFVTVGPAYGAQVVENARALGGFLAAHGFDVIGAERGFTGTHQVLVDVSDLEDPSEILARLAGAGVLVNGPSRADRRVRNKREDGLWLRLGTSACTRVGMGPTEMAEIAMILSRVLLSREDPANVRGTVTGLCQRHSTVHFTVETAPIPADG